jgi:hypothetical protein
MGLDIDLNSENRKMSLQILERGIRIDSELKEAARKHSGPESSFEALAKDEEFLRITEKRNQS